MHSARPRAGGDVRHLIVGPHILRIAKQILEVVHRFNLQNIGISAPNTKG